MSVLADRFPTLARHLSVLRESWRAQDEADEAFRPREEHEFLPAALEIMEKPPSPGMRLLLWLTCGLLVLALIWAVLGKIDVVAVASGRVVPGGNVKTVQPIDIGAVRAIHVTNGQFVRAGELLIELDPTLASADEAQSEQSLMSARVLRARNDALLAYLEGRPARYVAPPEASPDTVATERALIRAAIAEYEAQRASLRQQRAEKAAELQGAEAEIAKLEEALPYIEEQYSAREELAERGFYSRLRLLEYEQLRAEHLRNIEIQRANAARAGAAIGTLDAEIASLRAGFGRNAVTELADANEQASMAGEEVRKAERRRQYQELRSPVDGVVQQLSVTTVGGVVQPAQVLMVIVPCSAEGAETPASCNAGITVDAFVQNKDIGFVAEGQRVAVKLEAFNFTDFGMLEGTVRTISRDAIDQSQQPAGSQRDENGRPVQPGLVYATSIALACGPDDPARTSLCDRVQPGMAVQAEIKTGQRRIIQYLLSPISQALDEAGRER
ncbi:HlyD family type I secretion periplasmic adaptor subunit [Alteraurantiacibacter aquimixticola]|uniref:Membrane fusion protein (MFP) family protein n=1 Tax=Alteraurantiacibacter aquimixticola TaxID=2489173 RepID=A0A4T3F498_9SPHN|nr:HlyD family type I secretion periplasmic adaptor subunit [Alteraurantiacibacter aquimixticola]TIX51144.1 HlyD family type I secretion periplasmic adaptor subunit [Alteraurantiacibacter aquimixticola]